jgi:hypothetical protein
MSRPLLQQEEVTINPFQKIEDFIIQERRRSSFEAWRRKNNLHNDLLVVRAVVDRLKMFINNVGVQMGSVASAVGQVKKARAQAKKAEGEELADDDPVREHAEHESTKARYQIKGLFLELLNFSRHGRMDFFQFAFAEVFEAMGNPALAAADVVNFYKSKVSMQDQLKQFMTHARLPFVHQDHIRQLEQIASLAIPTLLPKMMQLQSTISEQVQMATDVQNKLLAAMVSVGIAFSSVAAQQIKQVLFPSCMRYCSD